MRSEQILLLPLIIRTSSREREREVQCRCMFRFRSASASVSLSLQRRERDMAATGLQLPPAHVSGPARSVPRARDSNRGGKVARDLDVEWRPGGGPAEDTGRSTGWERPTVDNPSE
jgi:hypothetical protein